MNDKINTYPELTTIQQYKADVDFRVLMEGMNEKLYIIPQCRREYHWSKEQIRGLVESLLFGLPIPPIYAYRNEQHQLEILDGCQRVMSLFFYYIGYFMNKSCENAISFLELDFEDSSFASALMKQVPMEKLQIDIMADGEKINVDYASLSAEMKRRVDNTLISIIEIKIGQEDKEEILRSIYENLN